VAITVSRIHTLYCSLYCSTHKVFYICLHQSLPGNCRYSSAFVLMSSLDGSWLATTSWRRLTLRNGYEYPAYTASGSCCTVTPYSNLRDSIWFVQNFWNSRVGTLAMVRVTTTTVNYIEEAPKALDPHKPADSTHTSCTRQEMAVNPPRVAYSGNCVFSCAEYDRSTLVPLLTFTSVNSEKKKSLNSEELYSCQLTSPASSGILPLPLTSLELGLSLTNY
jgi:hypothetical protein